MAVAALALDGARISETDSPLGRWLTADWSPDPLCALSGIVESIWYFDGKLTYARERVFPDGCADLIVQLDEVHRDGDNALTPFPAVCINGVRSRAGVVVGPSARTRVLGVRLNPAGAYAVLHQSIGEVGGNTLELRECVGLAAAELGERCWDAANARGSARNAARAIVTAAAAWLTQRVYAGCVIDPALTWAFRVMRSQNGIVPIEQIQQQTGLTRAQFAARFRGVAGVTPKRYARILRFHRAASRLVEVPSISGAAMELGYFDQAHLHRDFVEFAGMTPSAFVGARRYAQSLSLAEG
ncbi:MAG TPA: helix-turn-helix domain-containing protein [Candidatus Baltobacteraceae bacterium]|jgi:AraC-like DNA-binding protein|nr:helix-turn-helix domain-containing protein [Candidatus Baltobacteraceae bacterium]